MNETSTSAEPLPKPKPWNRPLLKDPVFWWILGGSLAVALFGVIPFMGLPGGIMVFGTITLYFLMEDFTAAESGVWGLAIVLTLVVPPFLPLGYALAWHALRKLPPVAKWAIMLGIPWLVANIAVWVMLAGYAEKQEANRASILSTPPAETSAVPPAEEPAPSN
jgi:hypothetical protein